jgi:prepilin-type N-terminal cleavage/methylation domain-containing protein
MGIHYHTKKINYQRGFTIVELLIVIVVIGILAAITIVAYNGVQTKAKTTSAVAAANTAMQKAELYNTDQSRYPLLTTELTGAATTTSYYLTGVTFGTPAATAPPNTLSMLKCGSGTPATQSAITAANVTGNRFYYWDYTNGNANSYDTSGVDTGTGIACPAAP